MFFKKIAKFTDEQLQCVQFSKAAEAKTFNFEFFTFQKQLSRGVFKKRCSENIQQIYKRTHMPKCDFNKVALRLLYLFLGTPLGGDVSLLLTSLLNSLKLFGLKVTPLLSS